MDQHLVFLLLGLANGAVFAALALGLVVVYRSSGVLNFATGAIALYAAYIYAYLRHGSLLLLIPGLPKTIDLGEDLDFLPATLIAVAIAALLGLLLYVTTFRPLRGASPIAKAVASLGWMVVLTAIVVQRIGTTPVNVDAIFPTDVYTLGSIRVSADRLWFAATIVIVTAVVAAAYRYTRFGLHTRAAAESEKGAYLCGISPDRIAALNWMIGAAVCGLAGILISPISPLVPYSYTLFIVPALAAAIFGGFQWMVPAVSAGLVIGMLQSEVLYLQTRQSWLPSSGMAELVPLVLILVVLVVRAKPLPSRGMVLRPNLGRAPRPGKLAMPTLVGIALGTFGILILHGSWRDALVTSFIFGVISLSLVVVTGYAGQVSLAQLTLAGVGGFLLSTFTEAWGVPFPIAPILAALGATVLGVVVGLPALRVRGLPVAVVTLSLAVALQALWFRNLDFVGSGGKTIVGPEFFGIDLTPGIGAAFPRPEFCFLALAVLVIAAIGVAKLRSSSLGSSMLAVRANERSAQAAGINVLFTKIAAFAIGAFIAGIGGSMLAYKLRIVSFDSFDVLLGLGFFATVYLAGITSVSGGVLAGVLAFGGLVYFGTTDLGLDPYWYQIVAGVGLVLSVILNPEGIVGPIHQAVVRRRDRRVGATKPEPASAAAPLVASAPGRNGPLVTLVEHDPAHEQALSIKGLSVRYGGVVAVADVSFDVPQGSIVGLIGPNGAGKTTLIDALSGFCAYDGTVELAGRRLDKLPPYRRIRAGLGRTFQGIELWTDLTVGENVLVGHGARRRSADDIDQVFDFLGLRDVRERYAGELSQGQRQLVSIARSLIARPRVLLLDEPAAGLDSNESAWLGERLRAIRGSGVTILLVDHDMSLVLNLCDHIEVVDFGKLIARGAPQAISEDRAVMAAYLGTGHAESQART